jgi:hypothetical protein
VAGASRLRSGRRTTARIPEAIGLRALTSRDWSGFARRLVNVSKWQGAPWVAVRTSTQSMVLLASTLDRPSVSALDRVAGAIRHAYGLAAPNGAPGQADRIPPSPGQQAGPAETAQEPARLDAAPMRILDARHDRRARLAVLVDRMPDWAELRFTPHLIVDDRPWRRHPGPDTLYVAVHPGGYVSFLLDNGDGQGFYGEPFDLRLVDGTQRTIVGPWSSRAAVVADVAPEVDVYPDDVAFHDDPGSFYDGGGGGRSGNLTRPAAQRALFLAASYPTSAQSPTLAQAFTPLHTTTSIEPTGGTRGATPPMQSGSDHRATPRGPRH